LFNCAKINVKWWLVKCPLKCMSEVGAVYYMRNSVSAGRSIEKRTTGFNRRDWKGLLVSLKCDHLLFVLGFYSVPAPCFGGLQNLPFLGFLMITHKNLDPAIKINNIDCCVHSCCKFYCSVISSIMTSVQCKFYSWNHVLPNEKESLSSEAGGF
jgi:hypothetical protein